MRRRRETRRFSRRGRVCELLASCMPRPWSSHQLQVAVSPSFGSLLARRKTLPAVCARTNQMARRSCGACDGSATPVATIKESCLWGRSRRLMLHCSTCWNQRCCMKARRLRARDAGYARHAPMRESCILKFCRCTGGGRRPCGPATFRCGRLCVPANFAFCRFARRRSWPRVRSQRNGLLACFHLGKTVRRKRPA